MKPIRAVLLDVGGVLMVPDHDLVRQAMMDAGVAFDAPPDAIDQAHYAGAAALDTFPAENAEVWRSYQEAYARALGVPGAAMEAAVSALAEAFARPEMFRRPVAGALEGLRALANFGVALAVVSNASGQVEGSLRDAGLCQTGPGDGVTVGAVIDSHVVGVAKPDPRIFEIALDAVGIHPSRAVHVGDVVGADVVGAEAAGIRPLHMDPYGLCGDHSHAHVASMADVAELVVA